MEEDLFSLDQVIGLVNFDGKLPTSAPNIIQISIPSAQSLPAVPKNLIFKPWSGNKINSKFQSNNDNKFLDGQYDCIHQEIENISDEQQSPQKQLKSQTQINPNNSNQDKPAQNINEIRKNQETGQHQYLFKFQSGGVKLIKHLLQENGFKQANNSSSWTIYWSSSAIKLETYHSLLSYQKINHFPNSFHITRKDLMNKTISKMQQKYGHSHFSFLPKTYLLPQELNQLLQQNNKVKFKYIVKPHNRSQGKGIIVTDSLSTIYAKLEKYSSLIVSHYIQNPLLINKLKFDLRIYVSITGINPLRIYIYEQGLARFATQQYDEQMADTQSKRFQHLTNYSVNKKNVDFIPSNQDQYFGSKWSLTSLKDFLSYAVGKQETLELFDRIDDVIIKTLICAQNTIFTSFNSHVPYINNCFEVFGFDILIDSNLKPWLVQVNLSPSMNTDSPLDLKIKGNMIADLFTMIGVSSLEERFSLKLQTHQFIHINDRQQRQKSNADRCLLRQIQLQKQRSGGWRRVFPNSVSFKYKNFFQSDRYFNRLMRQSLILNNNNKWNMSNAQGYMSNFSNNTSKQKNKLEKVNHTKPFHPASNKSIQNIHSHTQISQNGQKNNYRSNTLGKRTVQQKKNAKVHIRLNKINTKNKTYKPFA